MAPIFDSGNSMFYDSMGIPNGNELLKIKETKLLSYIRDRGLVSYLQKIKYLEDFQKGADLSAYNYVKSMNLFL